MNHFSSWPTETMYYIPQSHTLPSSDCVVSVPTSSRARAPSSALPRLDIVDNPFLLCRARITGHQVELAVRARLYALVVDRVFDLSQCLQHHHELHQFSADPSTLRYFFFQLFINSCTCHGYILLLLLLGIVLHCSTAF